MFDGSIIRICDMRVWSMRLISGNWLKTLILILMSITHSYSLLRISYVLMSPHHIGTDSVIIESIWGFWGMWKWKGRRRMEQKYRMMHAVGRGLWFTSGLLSLQGTRKSGKMMNKISLMVKKCWRKLCCYGLTRAVLFAKTHSLYQCLLLNNCGSMDSVSFSLSIPQNINIWWITCLT